VTEAFVRAIADEVMAELEDGPGLVESRLHAARKIFEEVALSDYFVDFLTLPAYEQIN
jgi:malate synthase